MAKQELTYTQAIEEVETIVAQIENNELDIDSLTESVQRVSFLLQFCKAKLKSTEEHVEEILKNLEE